MRSLALLCFLLLGACSDFTGSGELPLDFDRVPLPDAVTAEGGVREIVITGSLETLDCHAYEVERALLDDDGVTLRLEYTDEDGDCAPTFIARGYRARIRGLDAGTYRVGVEYVGDVMGPPLNREVAVRSD